MKASIKKPGNINEYKINSKPPKVELLPEYVVGYRSND